MTLDSPAEQSNSPKKSRNGRRRRARPFTVRDADELYGVSAWGNGYFRIAESGNIRVHPTRRDDEWVELTDVVDQMRRKRAPTPLVVRFPQIVESQVDALRGAFAAAIRDYDYGGRYRGVFPIKVNQFEPFVSELVRVGSTREYGLEAGTKPELALVLASGLPPGSLVICNGYKDRSYLELALTGTRLGYRVVLILEKLHELELALDIAAKMGVDPLLGIRLKVHARGTGKWAKSGGDASKFGLTTSEILHAVSTLEARGKLDCLKLLHFHIGSQITSVRRIKSGVREGARFYAALRSRGVDLELLDVGGGLGIDYDGSRTSSDSSVNYTLEEYANDVVYTVQEVCEEAGVPVPDLVSESGRAVSAYHSVAVFSVERRQTEQKKHPTPAMPTNPSSCVRGLRAACDEINAKNYVECYHDALDYLAQMRSLFDTGHLSLEERAVAETDAARLFSEVVYYAKASGRRIPEEIEQLEQDIAAKYVCNFSIFQTMPDLWAIGQLFPICPIHRLDETPEVWATIADITCDSDGKIDKFPGVREDADAIRLHELQAKPYHLGAFLVGAYQDVMGDFHNMLGETKEARVVVTGPGQAEVVPTRVAAQSSGEILGLFGHKPREMARRFRDRALEIGLDEKEVADAIRVLRRVLNGTPYLS